MNFISKLPLKKYTVSFLLAFIITLFLFSVASIIFSFFPPSDLVLGILTDYAYLFSGFLASFFCGRASSRRGFVTGVLSSSLYIALLLILGSALFKSTIFTSGIVRVFVLSALLGGIGGILGINCK